MIDWPVLATVVAGALVAVGLGGTVVRAIFTLVDRDDAKAQAKARVPGVAGGVAPSEPSKVSQTSQRLRGGAWIGRLERLAIYATLLAGYPEAMAFVLAIKGLARYPELRVRTSSAAEGFIIGTFVSVLWAASWAGLVWWLWHRVLA